MKNAIITKLREHLAQPIDNECKVVYLLAEVRKLLDAEPPDPPLHLLRLHSNWSLHVDLANDTGANRAFLTRIDRIVGEDLNGTIGDLIEHQNLKQDFASLQTLRTELKEFLAAHHLPTTVCDQEAQWNTFVREYAGVIQDGSLTCASSRLTNISKIVFTKGQALPVEFNIPFSTQWTAHLQDGRRLHYELKAIGALIVGSLKLEP